MMPTLNGSMPHDLGPERPCIWCKNPTDITFVPEFAPKLGPQPMHLTCGIALMTAYLRYKRGEVLTSGAMARLIDRLKTLNQ